MEKEETISNFQSFAAEGDNLFKQSLFQKAVEAYSKALHLKPTEKHILVNRSKCYLQLGDAEKALQDADESLKQDSEFFKGIYQKAEALYQKGDFEMSLVYFHRGNVIRPDGIEFRLGIQKASEAIDNSIGDPKYHFKAPTGTKLVSGKETNWSITKPTKPKSSNTKALLGELAQDHDFLTSFMGKDFGSHPNAQVTELVDEALKYLDTRTEFWRQQKPIYSRKREPKITVEAPIKQSTKTKKQSVFVYTPKTVVIPSDGKTKLERFVDVTLTLIHNYVAKGDYETALRKIKSVLSRLSDSKKLEMIAECWDLCGSIQVKLGQLTDALVSFKKELVTGTTLQSKEIQSRAKREMAKVYVQLKKYSKAITLFEQTVDDISVSYDIGKCHLQLRNYEKAREYGLKSSELAKELKDEKWIEKARELVEQASKNEQLPCLPI